MIEKVAWKAIKHTQQFDFKEVKPPVTRLGKCNPAGMFWVKVYILKEIKLSLSWLIWHSFFFLVKLHDLVSFVVYWFKISLIKPILASEELWTKECTEVMNETHMKSWICQLLDDSVWLAGRLAGKEKLRCNCTFNQA